MWGHPDNEDLTVSGQETVEPKAELSEKSRKQKSDAGLKGQNAMLRGKILGLETHIGELENKPEVGQDVPWKHADLPSYLPKCPGGTCGKPNPNFPGLEKLAICKNCKHPVGTPEEIKNDLIGGIKGSSCPWCDGKEAIMPEVSHD